MTRIALWASALLLVGPAWAQGLDGTYAGVSMVTARSGDPREFPTCGDVDDVSFTVKGDAIALGPLTGKIAADGSFTLQGKLKPDADATSIIGTIKGKELSAKWTRENPKISCTGAISAER